MNPSFFLLQDIIFGADSYYTIGICANSKRLPQRQ